MSLKCVPSLGEQVAAPERHALRGAAAVLPQVDDQRVRAADQFHGRGDGWAGLVRVGYPTDVQVADVAVQPLDPEDPVVGRVPALRAQPAGVHRLGRLGTFPPQRPGQYPDPQVLVRADLVELAGEPFGERGLVQVVVLPGGQPGLDRGGGLLGPVGEHVTGAQQRDGRLHGLVRGQRLLGERRVVRQAHRGRGVPRVRDGEFQHLGRGKPQRKLAAQPLHAVLVGPRPVIEGPLRIFRRRRAVDVHPDQQVVRLIAVLQHSDPLYCASREARSDFAIDEVLQAVEFGPLHYGLPGPFLG